MTQSGTECCTGRPKMTPGNTERQRAAQHGLEGHRDSQIDTKLQMIRDLRANNVDKCDVR